MALHDEHLAGAMVVTGSRVGSQVRKESRLLYMVAGIPKAARDSKPQWAFAFRTSACVIAGKVSWPKAESHGQTQSEFRRGPTKAVYSQQGLSSTVSTFVGCSAASLAPTCQRSVTALFMPPVTPTKHVSRHCQ